MSKWKWLFINSCECNSSVYAARVLQLVPSTDQYITMLGEVLKNNDTSMQ